MDLKPIKFVLFCFLDLVVAVSSNSQSQENTVHKQRVDNQMIHTIAEFFVLNSAKDK